jgi:cytochrome P450
VRQSRGGDGAGDDIITSLCHAQDGSAAALDDRQVRDYVVSLLAAGTETTTMALTWIWVALQANPSVAAKLFAEIDETVSEGPVQAAHLPGLRYTKMVIQETLRLYPVGWIFPRQASAADTIRGIRIKRGGTVLLSPYLTHRMAQFWPRPHSFEPERFSNEAAEQRHRYAYFPFSGGIHQCLGSHFFTVEAQLIVATVVSRYRPRLVNRKPVSQRAGVTLRPGQTVQMVLAPKIGATA